VFLEKGLAIAIESHDEDGIHSIYNNIGNVYYRKRNFEKALPYFQRNYRYHLLLSDSGNIWLDRLNLADDFLQTKKYDSAFFYAQGALDLAQSMKARSKEADSYSILAQVYSEKGDYKGAYESELRHYTIDSSLINEATNKRMADLQERFNARQREQDNRLLMAEVQQAVLQRHIVTYLAIAAAVIALLIGVSLYQKRQANRKLKQQNELIKRQNEKLAELNYEKNSLISIVSHDLGSPFSAIKMWSQVLEAEDGSLTAEQQKAVARIQAATQKGETLIRTILDVEKAETNKHIVQLENFNLSLFVENLVDDFRPSATGKNIHLHYETPGAHIYLVSDKVLVARICENLVSNALKYTLPGKNVWISVADEQDAVNIKVKDEGVGIEPSEMPHLFSRYSNISSRPTSGEASTGLGLSIVKRIVQELNGSVFCESEPGKGSLFTIVLGK
jgi:signal transduction histidine kinase